MTDKISLYYTAGSPPSRACINLARILNVEIELKNVNMIKGELHTEWFKQLNPVKKIPVMVYNGFILAESRAILAYIVNKWKPGSSWYPNIPEQRALIDQRMYFDATIVFPSLGGVVVSIFESYQSSTVVLFYDRDQSFLILEIRKQLRRKFCLR